MGKGSFIILAIIVLLVITYWPRALPETVGTVKDTGADIAVNTARAIAK